jgi:hypothetical protein
MARHFFGGLRLIASHVSPTDDEPAVSGGEILEVKREDDPDGRWNYEVVVKTSGKDCKLF